MSARSGQKTSVIPIQTEEHQYQQYVQIWSYLKPGNSVLSAKFERAEGVSYAKHVGHTNILPKPHLQPAAICPQPELQSRAVFLCKLLLQFQA